MISCIKTIFFFFLKKKEKTSKKSRDKTRTAFYGRLKLTRHDQDSKFMKERLTIGLGYTKSPASAVQVIRILPHRLCAFAEDMDCVTRPDLVPGVVVVYSVECGNVGDVFVQNSQTRDIFFFGGLSWVPARSVCQTRMSSDIEAAKGVICPVCFDGAFSV